MKIEKNTYRFVGQVLLLVVLFPLIGYIYHTSSDKPSEPTTGDIVYICTSNMATRYHSTPDCEGLQSCSSRIIRISKDKAVQQGKSACRLCKR